MDQVTEQKARDGNGRFAPGCSGNPKGKAPGTRNRATVLRALMRDGDEDAIGRVLIDRALGGDSVAARFLIDGLNPKPRQRTITLDLPDGADAAAIFLAAATAMVAGEISPQEASSVVHFLEDGQRMVQAAADIKRGKGAHRGVAAVRAARRAASEGAARREQARADERAPRPESRAAEPQPPMPSPPAPSTAPPVAPPTAMPTRRRAA